MNKQGYVFAVDATIAIILLIVGISFIFIATTNEDQSHFLTEQLAQDLIGVMAETRITDVCDLSSGCSCATYPQVEDIICGADIKNEESSLLELLNELITRGSISQDEVEEMIRDLFIDHPVVDEDRFGFALIYTDPLIGVPLELYNSDTYEP